MSDPATEILVDVASSAISEVLKSVLQGLGMAKDWFRATATEYDPFGVVAKRYAERMQQRHGSIRIFGMSHSIPLRDVYVRVNLMPKITSQHRSTITDLDQFFDRDQRRFGSVATSIDGLDLVKQPEMTRIFVLGKPGAGKTTFLKWLALQGLGRHIPDGRIPLFVSLKDWSDSKLDLFLFAVAEFDSCGFPDAEAFVQRLLETGGFLILFDGLDEITGDVNKLTAELRRFTEKYPDNRFVISCRIAAYNYIFEKFTDVEMADFSPSGISRFAEQWFAAAPVKARMFREKLAESHNAPIRELASTPLLLTMLCLAFDELMDFPRNRSDLYGEAIDALLKKWDASRNIRREDVYKYLSPRQKQDLLSTVAAETFPKGHYFVRKHDLEQIIADYIVNLPTTNTSAVEIDSEAVLKSIEAQHGLLVERAQRIYSFSHLTFQEFFMARHLATTHREQIEEIVRAHVGEAAWREVFLLLAEMLPLADELLSSIRLQLTSIAVEAKLARLLREIEQSGMLLTQDVLPRHIQRIATLVHMDNLSWHGLHDVVEPAGLEILNSLGYQMRDHYSMKNYDPKIGDSRLYDIVDEVAVCGAALDLGFATDKRLTERYIRGTQLLVECLHSEAYVTVSLRKALMEGLCVET